MKAILLAIVCAAICAGSAHAKGPPPTEVTRESIEQNGIPWEIRVQNEEGAQGNPNSRWFFSILIKRQNGEHITSNTSKSTSQAQHVLQSNRDEAVGRLEMRDEDGNLLMSADLRPNSSTDQAIEYQFSVHKKRHADFSFWFCPVREHLPIYFVKLDKLIDEKTPPQMHLEWPRSKSIAPADGSERSPKRELPLRN